MKRFAFIDVQNTETTTLKVLGFIIYFERLFYYLRDVWECEKVFFYHEIKHGDQARIEVFEKISQLGAVVRPKYFFIHKNEDEIETITCPNCQTQIIQKIDMGYSWKCNCDVELTADVLEKVDKETEIFLFSGDGDFEFLIEKIVVQGTKVSIVSSAKRIQKESRNFTYRLSTKIRKLTQPIDSPVKFIEINNLKFLIRKEV